METDEDDPMEIDDTVPAAPIIERKSEQFTPVVESSEEKQDTTEKSVVAEKPSATEKPVVAEKPSATEKPVVAEKPSATEKSVKVEKPSATEKPVKAEKPSATEKSVGAQKADDVVVLLDDDEDDSTDDDTEDAPVQDIIDLVPKANCVRCVNSSCKGVCSNFICAPEFCLSYFRVKQTNKKKDKEEVCENCYDQAVAAYEKLAVNLTNGEVVLNVELPIINETWEIDDSDEEDEGKEEKEEYIDEENFDFITENIDTVLEEAYRKFRLDSHMEKEKINLNTKMYKTEDSITELTEKVKKLRHSLDGIQFNLYNQFRPDVRELKALTIVDDANNAIGTIIRVENPGGEAPGLEPSRKSTRVHKPVSYVELDDLGNSNSPVTMEPTIEKMEPPPDLPMVGTVDKPLPKIGEIYYICRENNAAGSWIRARLQCILQSGKDYNGQIYSTHQYKLVELKQQKERLVDGKHIAYMSHCKVRLSIGTRVIAVFKEESKKLRHDPYYPGIIGEAPYDGNKYRYLIFFDIGYAQYVNFLNVHLVFDVSKDVWEDMSADSRPFIKKYLESQDRPMVKLAKDQTVRTEYNGKWWLCTVMDVDCSLVKVYFENLNRMEWIYRGSTRLSPMFREEQAATNRHSGLRTSRKAGPNESATVVQYTRTNDYNVAASPEKSTEPKESTVRAVARKSTTRPQSIQPPASNIVPFLPTFNNSSNTSGPTSKIMYFTPRDQAITRRMYRSHTCSIRCRDHLTHNCSRLRGHNPLSKPLLCGWARLTQKARGRKEIVYKAPCGRLLRNIADVHMYLRQTESYDMTVDLFDFNHMVRCLAEFSVECKPDPADLSNGLEHVPIPVINGINNEMLDFCNYSTKRVPMEGVHMNLDPEFLCGCDCEDDCIDKTKCACWKMTLEGAKFIGKDIDPNSVGYIYRRLPEQVITGIYECNPRCKCKSTCLNRVVQNPMSLKLQVFKTHNRGWGIRCLNDVPQGSFICIYAGTLHTEQMANEDGMAYGDEYFAELDYIETVEKFKEDYEAEAMEDDDYPTERRRSVSPDEEEDDDEEEEKNIFRAQATKTRRYSDDNDFKPSKMSTQEISGIRARLRRRNNEEEMKFKQEDSGKMESKIDTLTTDIDTVTISDDEDECREVLSFNPKTGTDLDEKSPYISVREVFGPNESVYIMDAKNAGNIGRFLNHSCSPNVFVQNVFVDTQDPRFPWVAFFSSQFIRAGTELTWNYNYDIGSVPGRVLYCHCASLECKGRLL